MKFNLKNSILFVAFIFATTFSFATVIQPLAGSSTEAGNQIEWEVDNTIDIQFFIIQRSFDGVNFMPIATKQISKNTTYNFLDKKMGGKTCFYRIVKVGKDGVGDFSSAITLK